MDLDYELLGEKVISDWLFAASLNGLMLLTRKRMLNQAINGRKVTTLTQGLLAYEKKRGVNSHIFYVERTLLYLVGATVADLTGEYSGNSSISRLAKGLIWGLCFFNLPFSFALAGSNAAVGHFIEPYLLQLI